MSIARLSRERKRQLGQYLTPADTAAAIVEKLRLSPDMRILEPSFGEGAFVFAILDAMAARLPSRQLGVWARSHLFGCELDDAAYRQFHATYRSREIGSVPTTFEHADFFTWMPPGCDRRAALVRREYFALNRPMFDLVIGNPPFGGSIDPAIQDELDAIHGFRNGRKIKKETYAFFIVKCLDHLKPGGRLVFICSDTILTIPTMTGLRNFILANCDVDVSDMPGAFADTNQDMLLLTLTKTGKPAKRVTVFGRDVPLAEIEATPNLSWQIDSNYARYFTGATVGDKMVASSGMTIGNNELFLRRIENGAIVEPYEFAFAEEPITLEREIERARLGKVSPGRRKEIAVVAAQGATETVVRHKPLAKPSRIALPHADYRFYNKATSRILYADPEWVVYWRNEGEFVYTFKKSGNWYLRGVGGKPYFGREGLTWSLIAPRLYARYLPAGYILDSGAPCAFLRDGVAHDELFFILGWALTDTCNEILKNVLNHTRNIQSKDFERLPYPVWVEPKHKRRAIRAVLALIDRARAGEEFTFRSGEIGELNRLYQWERPTASA